MGCVFWLLALSICQFVDLFNFLPGKYPSEFCMSLPNYWYWNNTQFRRYHVIDVKFCCARAVGYVQQVLQIRVLWVWLESRGKGNDADGRACFRLSSLCGASSAGLPYSTRLGWFVLDFFRYCAFSREKPITDPSAHCARGTPKPIEQPGHGRWHLESHWAMLDAQPFWASNNGADCGNLCLVSSNPTIATYHSQRGMHSRSIRAFKALGLTTTTSWQQVAARWLTILRTVSCVDCWNNINLILSPLNW